MVLSQEPVSRLLVSRKNNTIYKYHRARWTSNKISSIILIIVISTSHAPNEPILWTRSYVLSWQLRVSSTRCVWDNSPFDTLMGWTLYVMEMTRNERESIWQTSWLDIFKVVCLTTLVFTLQCLEVKDVTRISCVLNRWASR